MIIIIQLEFGQNLATGHPPDSYRKSLAQRGMAAAKRCPNEHLPSIRELFGGLGEIQNYRRIKDSIAEAAYKCGRNPEDIQLVAVTKGHPWNDIKPLYAAGCRDFGESRLQEALPKIENAPEDIQWHLIGTLQKNKVLKALESFALIHSVDSYELAVKISDCSREEGTAARILLQVNTSGETTKRGFSVESLKKNFEKVYGLPAIQVEGLMTIAPLVDDERIVRHCFARLWNLRDELIIYGKEGMLLPHLSMGMSRDYPWAIQEGATLLRIGTAIFQSN
jgi:PLP dependent protein